MLERLSGALCDAVTGRAGSQAMLEYVEQAGLFLAPLDEVRGWWRYHHLFADLLRARLQDEQPGRVSQLHRTATAWYEVHGLADDAIRHAVAIPDMTWAARLIEQHFDAVFYLRGEAATIQRWISALPDDLVRSRSRLLLAQAQMANASGRAGAAGPLLDAAERASEASADEPFAPAADPGASLLANVTGGIAIGRAYLAALRGDAEATAASLPGLWPSSARTTSCLGPSRRYRWPWHSGSAASWRRPSGPWSLPSPGGRRLDSTP